VVIAIIAILAAMLLPALGRAKLKALGMACLNHHRSLALAWRMYADASGDRFPLATCVTVCHPEEKYAWMSGHLDFDPANRSNWDVEVDIKRSPLFRYAPATGIFKCPADRSAVNVPGRGRLPRVRSMNINQHVGGFDTGTNPDWLVPWRFYRTVSDLTDPGPSHTWLFLDMREDSVNYPTFEVVMDGWPDQPALHRFMYDLPASYHGRAGGLSFTDGHSEIRRWRDPRTMPSLAPPHTGTLNPTFYDYNTPNNPDIRWLQDRTPRPFASRIQQLPPRWLSTGANEPGRVGLERQPRRRLP
jgi:hypothetical protein